MKTKKETAKQIRKAQGRLHKSYFALKRFLHKKTAEEQAYNAEREIAVWTKAVGKWTRALVIVGVITAVILFLQWRTFEKTDETMRAGQRPWVSVQITVDGPLVFSETEARLPVAFVLKNTGNTPAVNTQVDSEVALFLSNAGTPDAKMREICDRSKSMPDDHAVIGHAIFPGDKFIYRSNLPKLISEIKNAFTNWGVKNNETFLPVIVGCVSYRTPDRHGRHTTEFIVEVRKIDHSNPKTPGSFNIHDGIVPTSEMVLTRSFIGGNAD